MGRVNLIKPKHWVGGRENKLGSMQQNLCFFSNSETYLLQICSFMILKILKLCISLEKYIYQAHMYSELYLHFLLEF